MQAPDPTQQNKPPAAGLVVMCSNAFINVLRAALPVLEAELGCPVKLISGSSADTAANSILVQLRHGELADVVVLFHEALERLAAERLVDASTLVRIASSEIGVAVQRGAAIPEIGSAEHLRDALSRARSFAFSASASGVHVSTTLLDRLELPVEVRQRGVCVRGEPVGNVVARGEADLGFQQMSELLPVAGVKVVGPLPAALQKTSVISGAVPTSARDPMQAGALLEYLRSPNCLRFLTQLGLARCS